MNQVEVKRKQLQLCAWALGLMIIWILGKSIGDEGVAFLVAALESVCIFWALSSAQVADTLGRMLRGRSARGQYKNAEKLKSSVFIFQGILGFLGSILVAGLAPLLAERVFQVPYSKVMIYILAPTVFLRTISALLAGVFQGRGSELPSVVSSVLRQLLLLSSGYLFGKMLADYGWKVSMLLGKESFTFMYGGMGVALGILLAELLVVVFLLLIYKGGRKYNPKQENEGVKNTDSFMGQIFAFYSSCGAWMLCGLLALFPFVAGLWCYQKNVPDVSLSLSDYGVYCGQYLVFCGVVALVIAALSLPGAVKVSAFLRKEENRYARMGFQSGLKGIWVHGLFFAVITAILSEQLANVFGDNGIRELARMLRMGSAIIVLLPICFYCFTILKLLGKKLVVLVSMLVCNIVFVVSLNLWLAGQCGIRALVYAGVLASAVLALGLLLLTLGILRMGLDWIRVLAIPMGSACICGLVGYLLAKALMSHMGSMVTFIVIFVLSVLLYWIALFLLRCFSEQELSFVPGGRFLRVLGRMFRMF